MILKTSKTAERTVKALTVLSFVLLCWVAHRSLEFRSDCVNSSFISFVQFSSGKQKSGELRIANCLYKNRLSPRAIKTPLTPVQQHTLRALEKLDPLAELFKGKRTGLAVDITDREPSLFELGKGYVRVGTDWLNDPTQLLRALTMGVLKNDFPTVYTNQFQLEVMADFLLLAIFDLDEWSGEQGRKFSLLKDMRFSTTALSFDQYCLSPFRSLSHHFVCQLDETAEGVLENTWGFRPLLAAALLRVFDKLSLSEQLHMLESLRSGKPLPVVNDLAKVSAEDLATWLETTILDHLGHLLPRVSPEVHLALKRTMRELEVESPTRWELTLDLNATPAWREILEQMRQRAQFKKERVLIFTPEGARALPSGLPVAWTADEVRSQKHVLIACEWPRPEDTVHIQARHMFAHQSCTKLTRPFWD